MSVPLVLATVTLMLPVPTLLVASPAPVTHTGDGASCEGRLLFSDSDTFHVMFLRY
jgi:hypothetical protein